jgi:Protein of unknown function (DUF4231)
VPRLPVRLDVDQATGAQTVEVYPAIQKCQRRAYYRRIAYTTIGLAAAVIGAIVAILLGMIDIEDGPSTGNVTIKWTALALSAGGAIAAVISTYLDLERWWHKYESAARALDKVRDHYKLHVSTAGNAQDLNKLAVWAKDNVREIERLLGDRRITDIDLAFEPLPLP